jgi:hypothetical protein
MTDGTDPAQALSSREEFERDVIRRAAADCEFRRLLVADPRAALRTAYGVEFPPNVELRVLQETPSVFYLVLPPDANELSDAELEAVSGGEASEPMKMEYGSLRFNAIHTKTMTGF